MSVHPALIALLRELTAPKHPDFAALVAARNSVRAMADTLASGVDPDSEHPNGGRILHIEDLTLDVVRLLITAGADIEALHCGACLRTPLFFATQPGVATLLVQHGADLEARDLDNLTPLMFSAAYNDPQVVAELLALGADDQAVDKAGLDVLDHASLHLSPDDYARMEKVVKTHRAQIKRQKLSALLGNHPTSSRLSGKISGGYRM